MSAPFPSGRSRGLAFRAPPAGPSRDLGRGVAEAFAWIAVFASWAAFVVFVL